MSRAFTREIDDAPEAPLADLPVSRHANLVTARGARLIEERLALLDRELGEARDPATIELLRREQRYWAARRATMQVVAPPAHPNAAGFGTEAEIRRSGRTMRVRIVGEDEADPSQGLIAWTSPLAEALAEAEPGDVVELEAGGRTEAIEVLAVRP